MGGILKSVMILALLAAGCNRRVESRPLDAHACDDIRKIMIVEQKAKVAAKEPLKCFGKDDRGISNPKSCFWKDYERRQQEYIAENPQTPSPDQQRLADLEGKGDPTAKPTPSQSAHEKSCRNDIEADIYMGEIMRTDAEKQKAVSNLP